MTQTNLNTNKTQFSKDLKDQERVSSPFLIKYAAQATGKTGKPYLNLILTDRTGDLEARVFDGVAKCQGFATRDNFVWVEGNAQVYNGKIQVLIKELSPLREDEIDPKDYLMPTLLNAEKLYEELKDWITSMQDVHYRALMERIFLQDDDVISRMKRAPAAKTMHHAYPVGLLEHVLSILNILDFLSKNYEPHLNRDLLFVGGLMHDLGKIWELQYERTTDYTMEGRLVGHLVMGSELIEKHASAIEGFPVEKKLLAKHMVLAHHGKLEYGSPKEPQVLEAQVVHMVDDLDSKVNAIRMFIQNDANPGAWTLLNRQFERYFYKPEWARK